MQKAGVLSFGPFHWADTHTSQDLQQTLGDIPIIFIETAHFRLASTLETYRLAGDPQERKFIEGEIAELKRKLPKVKLSSSLDPWLRAHLYAQRLEQTYAAFLQDFSLTDPAPAAELGPYLGQKDKFTVLLTQSRSAYGRYVQRYLGVEDEHSYRFCFADSYFYGANFEVLSDHDRPYEIAFATALSANVAFNFVDAFRASAQAAPTWFKLGLAHVYARRTDPRWNLWNAGGNTIPGEDKKWVWEPRVQGLVRNEACSSWQEMMRWDNAGEVKASEHMIVWSRVDYLLQERRDTMRALLNALTEPLPVQGAERAEILQERQASAFQLLWSETPEELDQAWRKWVKRTYAKG